EQQADGTWKHDYLLCNAAVTTALAEFARVFKAGHRIEECLKRAKGEAGLADYQVRTWEGWHHHQALSLVATWFLTQETRRGKNTDAGADRGASSGADRGDLEPSAGVPQGRTPPPHNTPLAEAQRAGAAVSLEATQPLAATTVGTENLTDTAEVNACIEAVRRGNRHPFSGGSTICKPRTSNSIGFWVARQLLSHRPPQRRRSTASGAGFARRDTCRARRSRRAWR
ncbi:MAG TPA: hypothetical protein VKD72_16730, partial [Gemmataceae bacterium]|nr:hypothetical protein [Gemmataceae bacterium]